MAANDTYFPLTVLLHQILHFYVELITSMHAHPHIWSDFKDCFFLHFLKVYRHDVSVSMLRATKCLHSFPDWHLSSYVQEQGILSESAEGLFLTLPPSYLLQLVPGNLLPMTSVWNKVLQVI